MAMRLGTIAFAVSLSVVSFHSSALGGSSRIQVCATESGPRASRTWIVYGAFSAGRKSNDLYADEYTPPPSVPGPYPAAVMVHGGGWIGGCPVWNDELSYRLARDGFIVLNIDFRLACTDPRFYLCGWSYPTPVDDVQRAIGWMRQNADRFAPFSGKVAAVGTSSGGNLVYLAGDTGASGDTKPDAIAAASGQAELGFMSDGNTSCDQAWPPPEGPRECWQGSSAYMGVPFDFQGPACEDNWSPGSPACNVDRANLPPPTFIANATQELAAYQQALDFQTSLQSHSVEWDLCTVSGSHSHDHGIDLLARAVPCDEHPPGDVYTAMVNFLKAHLSHS